MKIIVRYILPWFLILESCFCIGQNRNIDSLRGLLRSDQPDTNKVRHLNFLCWEYINAGAYDTALECGKTALELGNDLLLKISDKSNVITTIQKGIAKSHINIGIIYWRKGNYDDALKNYFDALKLIPKGSEESEQWGKIAGNVYNNIGIIYNEQGRYDKSLENHSTALRIRLAIKQQDGIAASYNNIGTLYHNLADREMNPDSISARQLNYQMAMENYLASLNIREKTGNRYDVGGSYNNIAVLFEKQAVLEQNAERQKLYHKKAKENYLKSLSVREEIGDREGVAVVRNNLGSWYLRQNIVHEARGQAILSLEIAKGMGSKEDKKNAYNLLSLCDSASGNWKGAYENHALYKLYNDSIFNEESNQKTAEMSARYESEKKEAEIELLEKDKEKQSVVALAENKRHKTILLSVAGGLFLVIVFSLFMFNRWRITQKQKKIIEGQKKVVEEQKKMVEGKNKDIMDSIYYARRIQRSLLPTEKYIEKRLSQLQKN